MQILLFKKESPASQLCLFIIPVLREWSQRIRSSESASTIPRIQGLPVPHETEGGDHMESYIHKGLPTVAFGQLTLVAPSVTADPIVHCWTKRESEMWRHLLHPKKMYRHAFFLFLDRGSWKRVPWFRNANTHEQDLTKGKSLKEARTGASPACSVAGLDACSLAHPSTIISQSV